MNKEQILAEAYAALLGSVSYLNRLTPHATRMISLCISILGVDRVDELLNAGDEQE